MSLVAAPFGLRPSSHPSGTIRQLAMTIASAYNTNIFLYSPVAIAADGTLTMAAAGARAVGSFMGVEYTPTNGRRTYSNTWPANQVATEIVAYYTRDQNIVYQIQANGSLTTTDIGSQLDWTANGSANGSTVTGLSSVAADIASITAAASAGLRIIGISPGPDNTPGDTFTLIDVQISEHQDVADRVAY
jgi:hypothetical protein